MKIIGIYSPTEQSKLEKWVEIFFLNYAIDEIFVQPDGKKSL